MNCFGCQCAPRRLILTAALICSLMVTATEATAPKNLPEPDKSRPGPVALTVSGASAGITTDYFEQAVTEALASSGIFSGIDNSRKAEVTIPMIGASSTFSGIDTSSDAPYLLTIRVIKVDAPSFSIWMTVSMNAIWTLYRIVEGEKTGLLHENIHSTYTGGMFEGGFIGANRVRVAVEGAARENIRIGMGMLESLNLEQE